MEKTNNTLKLRRFLLNFTLLALLSSCGFISDDPVKGSDIAATDGLSSQCKISTDRIKKMFEINIEKDLNCVEDTLNKFKYVRNKNSDYFYKTDIEAFVRGYMNADGNAEDVVDALGLLFKLNTLLLRDEQGQMKRTNTSPFFELLKSFNRNAVLMVEEVKKLDEAKDQVEYNDVAVKLRGITDNFASEITTILSTTQGPAQAIDIQDLIVDITKDLKDFELGKEIINSLLFAKKLFLGGSRIYIDSDEFGQLFTFFPVFLQNTLDLFFLKKDYYEDGSEYFDKLAQNLEELKLYVFEHQREENIISINDIDNIIDQFFKTDDSEAFTTFAEYIGFEDDTNEKIKSIIKFAKRDIIGGDPEWFSYGDIEFTLAAVNIGLRSFESVNKLTSLVKDIDEKDFDEKVEIKKEFRAVVNDLTLKAKKLLEEDNTIPRDLEMQMLRFAQEVITLFDLDLDSETTRALFSIKVSMTGGTREVLTYDQLVTTLEKADPIATLYFDLMHRAKDYSEKTTREKNNFFLTQVRSLQELLLEELENDEVMSITDLNSIIDQFFKKEGDLPKAEALKNIVKNYKDTVLRFPPEKENMNFNELKSTVDLVAIVYRLLLFIDEHIENVKLKKEIEDGTASSARKIISRDTYIKNFLSIKLELENKLQNPDFVNTDVQIKSFLAGLKHSQAMFKKGFNWKLYSEAMAVKGMILGGENEVLTRDDLYYLTRISKNVSEALYDLFFTDFNNEERAIDNKIVLLETVRKIRASFYPIEARTDYFTAKQILGVADEILKEINFRSKEPKDESELLVISNFKRTLIDFTERMFDPVPRKNLTYPIPCKPNPGYNPKKQGSSKWICSEQDPDGSESLDIMMSSTAINNIFDKLESALEAVLFSEATYQYMEGKLQSPKPLNIKPSDYPTEEQAPAYKYISKKSYVTLIAEFSKVAKEYRYFRNKDGFPTYQAEIVRNKTGFNSIMLFRNVLPMLLTGYGKEGNLDDPRTSPGLADNQLNNALVGLKAALEEVGLWTDDFKTFGENILLLSDLFQATSGGDLLINLDEVTEFIELIFTSSKITGLLEESLYEDSGCEVREDDEGETYMESKCIRRNIFKKLLDKDELDLSAYFPRLTDYVRNNKAETIIEYVKGVEIFSRSVPNVDTQWWRTKDFTLVLGAMLNIESTFIRFDNRTQDNVLDMKELEKAYEVYDNAIIAIGKLDSGKIKLKFLGKTVFFYLLKYHEQKNLDIAWKWVVFKKKFKKFKAKRLDISELLKFLVEKRKPESPSLMVKEDLASCKLGQHDASEKELDDLFDGLSIEVMEKEVKQCHADFIHAR